MRDTGCSGDGVTDEARAEQKDKESQQSNEAGGGDFKVDMDCSSPTILPVGS